MTRSAARQRPGGAVRGAEFALVDLRKAFPEQYRTWVKGGVLSVGGAYLAVAVTEAAFGQRPVQDLCVVAAALVALGCIRMGHIAAAANLVLTAVWIECHLSFLEASDGALHSTSIALPALVMGIAMLAGGRAGVVAALITSVSVPLTLMIAHVLGRGPAFEAEGVLHLVVALVTMNVVAVMLVLFLRTLAMVLGSARHNADRAEALVEGSPDAVVAVGKDGRIEAFNAEAERTFGVPRDVVLGGDLSELSRRLRPESDERRDLDLGPEATVYRVADQERIVEGRCRDVGDGRGKVFVFRDISQRRDAEARARDLERELYHAQKMEAVGRLAGSVAHDFNNLLTVFGGYSELLQTMDSADVKAIARELAGAQRHAVTLTRQLLAFTRRDVGRARSIDLAEVLHGALPLVRRLVADNVDLQVEADEPCPMVADPGHVEQVILNLSANAADAMPKGGLLRIECRPVADRLELRVTDTGQGMDARTQERIFEPFFTTKDVGKGTGLGLATVHRIVTAYDGRIDVASSPGGGTTFVVNWPRGSLASDETEPETSAVCLPKGRGTVLVAEDDEAARQFLERLLAQAGYDVVVAGSGVEALNRMTRHARPPDLLLTDLSMPDLDGVGLARQLRAGNPRLPVVFMSGYTPEQVGGAPPDTLGVILAKPFSASELLGTIRSQLG